ncbi:hypothetical protein M404DRAFT_922271 [Pisolithus tinctorius Marx 270]|uniref:Uncharacterized protein n=1 Tax=Pisolithus tinctorius Marx 270 TaxID=870435 RepID=A0A0C3IJ40_PISTI|nr:hypothetical protein M404DRAFT_922271 [Pisolithus tinctorius Marx 270]
MISQNDEMGYWRNLVMRRGHQRLDPDYVNNAIRDIYENDLRHSVYDIHQTRQPRTPHSHRTFTPHLPRTHTSYVPQGNDPHLHAHTQTRAQFLRPVVTPVTPFSAIHDPLSHPPFTLDELSLLRNPFPSATPTSGSSSAMALPTASTQLAHTCLS